jgi:hypothetical protein
MSLILTRQLLIVPRDQTELTPHPEMGEEEAAEVTLGEVTPSASEVVEAEEVEATLPAQEEDPTITVKTSYSANTPTCSPATDRKHKSS